MKYRRKNCSQLLKTWNFEVLCIIVVTCGYWCNLSSVVCVCQQRLLTKSRWVGNWSIQCKFLACVMLRTNYFKMFVLCWSDILPSFDNNLTGSHGYSVLFFDWKLYRVPSFLITRLRFVLVFIGWFQYRCPLVIRHFSILLSFEVIVFVRKQLFSLFITLTDPFLFTAYVISWCSIVIEPVWMSLFFLAYKPKAKS